MVDLINNLIQKAINARNAAVIQKLVNKEADVSWSRGEKMTVGERAAYNIKMGENFIKGRRVV